LIDLKTGKSKPFIRKGSKEKAEKIEHFFLNPEILAEARRIIV